MMLTDTQKQTLATSLRNSTDPTVVSALAIRNDVALAAWLNAEASPVFRIWKTRIDTHDVKQACVWTEFIGRSQGERDAFVFMLSNGYIDASDPNIRAGFSDIFSGPNGAQTRANLIALAKRNATQIEKIFATGTGTDASPGTSVVEGQIGINEVSDALNRY